MSELPAQPYENATTSATYAATITEVTGSTELSPQERELDLYERIQQARNPSLRTYISRAAWVLTAIVVGVLGSLLNPILCVLAVSWACKTMFYYTDVLKGFDAIGGLNIADVPILLLLVDSADPLVVAVAKRHLARLLPHVSTDDPVLEQLSPSRIARLQKSRVLPFGLDMQCDRALSECLREIGAQRQLRHPSNILDSVKSYIFPKERAKAAALKEEKRGRARDAYNRALHNPAPVRAPQMYSTHTEADVPSCGPAASPTVRKSYFIAASLVFVPYGIISAIWVERSVPWAVPLYLLVAAIPLVLARYTLWAGRSTHVLRMCRMRDCDRIGDLIDILRWPDENILRMVTSALIRLLPLCNADQLEAITREQWWLIYNRVRRLLPLTRYDLTVPEGPCTCEGDGFSLVSDSTKFIITVLHCVEKALDSSALLLVKDVANMKPTSDAQFYLQAVAEHCLEQLNSALEAAEVQGTLLRASGHTAQLDDNLLHPLH